MRATTAAFLAAGLCAAPLAAQERPAQTPQERVHVVRPGDTLWDIARACTGDPYLWAEIYRLNADRVRDPARIYPRQELVLPDCGAPAEQGMRERLQARAQPRGEAPEIPTTAVEMPVVRPGDFFRASVLVPDAEIGGIGRLVGKETASVVPMETTPQVSLFDRVYVRLDDPSGVRLGDPVHFFRRDREVKPYGRVYRSTGIAVVEALEGNVATAVVRTVYDAIAPGDVAVSPARFPVRPGVAPGRVRQRLDGRIVGFEIPHPLQATQEIAFLDVGRAAGVQEGDEFLAVLPPEKVSWGTRPEIRVGRLQVVRVTGRTASARIVALEQPAMEPGLPVRLVAEMP